MSGTKPKILTKAQLNLMIAAINCAIEYEETYIYAWTGVCEPETVKPDKEAQKVIVTSRRLIARWQKLKTHLLKGEKNDQATNRNRRTAKGD